MFNLATLIHPLAQVPPDCTLKDFHHEGEKGSRQGGVPSTLRRLVAYEGMLSLDFKELPGRQLRAAPCSQDGTHRSLNIGVFESLANEVATRARDVCVLGEVNICATQNCSERGPASRKPSATEKKSERTVAGGAFKDTAGGGGRTTSSPLPVMSPLRTRTSESSFLPLPRVAEWTSVANQQKEASTRESNAACGGDVT